MNSEVSIIIKKLIELVGIIDVFSLSNQNPTAIIEDIIYQDKKNEIKELYRTFRHQQELFAVLETEFADDDKTQVYLLSILLKCTRDIQIIDQIINIVCKGNMDSYYNSIVEYQLTYEIFINAYPKNAAHDLKRKLHHYNVQRFKLELEAPTQYRPYHSRYKNRIAIVTEQLLGTNHAPSKIILDQCYTLQKELGMEVLLFVCPVDMSQENWMSWCEIVHQNYLPQLNGEYLIIYDEEGIQAAQKEANGIFYLQYKDIIIRGKQVLFARDTIAAQKSLLQLIFEYNPLYVYNMNSVNPVADICGGFTAVAASCMANGYPVSDADILLCLQNSVKELVDQEYIILEDRQQIAMNYQWHYHIEEPEGYYERSAYHIPEDEFVMAVVGNRLQAEIDEDFVKVLEHILELDSKISIILIGNYPNYRDRFNSKIFENRIYSIGFQEKLAAALKLADLYVNPPRAGGGISALYALYIGVPVITLPECDVAYNAGRQFICTDYKDMIRMVERYRKEPEFYDQQKKHAIDYTHEINDLSAVMRATVNGIENIITQAEEGEIF
jgi:glycosyltransferase involved in cell wall biosynthesis